MRADVTLNPLFTFIRANLAGGLAPSLLNTPALFPSDGEQLTYPLQKDCNTQGETTSLYYPYSKDLRNSGATFAVATTELGYPAVNQGVIQFKAITSTATTPA